MSDRRPSDREHVRYCIDADDVVVSVSATWNAFARSNGAPELEGADVVGRKLFEFVAGEGVRSLYRDVLDLVRARRVEVKIPFRCDGPDVRRELELFVRPSVDGAVFFDSVLLREEARRAVAALPVADEGAFEAIVSCSWCKKLAIDGAWLEIEAALSALAPFLGETPPVVSHGVCEACAAELRREIEACFP